MSGTRCEMSTARGQVTLEHLLGSKNASHSQNQQMGMRNPNRKPAIEDRFRPITSNGDFRPIYADFDSPARSRMHARPKSTQKLQIVTQNLNAHTSRSGDLLLHHRNPRVQAQNA